MTVSKKPRVGEHGFLSEHELEVLDVEEIDANGEWTGNFIPASRDLVNGHIVMPIPVVLGPRDDLQDLYNRFGGIGDESARLSWYGQQRAKGLSHDEAVQATAARFTVWVAQVWPLRGIPLPGT